MAHTPVLRFLKRSLLAIGILLAVAMVAAPYFCLPGCAIVHRYPAYRGKILELGTDKPIEGAGVLARYETQIASVGGWVERYLGYQAILSDKQGKFEVPRKWFFTFRPLSMFVEQPYITIYKKGYGNFPSSFHDFLPPSQRGKTEPEISPHPKLPAEMEIQIWLPILRTNEDQKYHDEYMQRFPLKDPFPPPGMTEEQFGYPGR